MLKRKFRIALASAGMTQAAWARKHEITEPTLTMLLNGKIKSKRLSAEIAVFIETEFKKLNITIGPRKAA